MLWLTLVTLTSITTLFFHMAGLPPEFTELQLKHHTKTQLQNRRANSQTSFLTTEHQLLVARQILYGLFPSKLVATAQLSLRWFQGMRLWHGSITCVSLSHCKHFPAANEGFQATSHHKEG